MAYGDFKEYQEEHILIEYVVIKLLILLNQSPKYNGYKSSLFLIVNKFFDEKPAIRADKYVNTTAALSDMASQTKNFQTKCNKHLLQNLKNVKCAHFVGIEFKVQI